LAEEAADDHAADGPPRALDLAEALLKVARLAPPGGHAALPVSAFHNGDRLAERVARLMSLKSAAASTAPPSAVDPLHGLGWGGLGAALALVASLAARGEVLARVHAVIESGVRFLQ
jgi:hypothetical protein